MKTSDKPSLKNRQNQKFRESTFVALDFETATNNHFPCQIGIVVYCNGKITSSYSKIIRPPQNKWDYNLITWHHKNTSLTPHVTEHEKEFNELWSEIEPYISNQFIIMHLAKSSDLTCLENVLEHYGIDFPIIKGYLCTKELYESTCKEYHITCSLILGNLYKNIFGNIDFKEHDACEDARACAELYFAYLDGKRPNNEVNQSELQFQDCSDNINLDNLFDLLPLPKEFTEYEYTKKTIVLSGEFNICVKGKNYTLTSDQRKDILVEWFKKYFNANVTGSISGKTNIFITGNNPGPSKEEEFHKQKAIRSDIKKITLAEFNSFIQKLELEEENERTESILKHPFYGKRFSLIGELNEVVIRKELRKYNAKYTAKNNNKYEITNGTDICIIGENPEPESIEKLDTLELDGYLITRIKAQEIGKYQPNKLNEVNTKTTKRNLQLNSKHLNHDKLKVDYSLMNPFSTKEIYLGQQLAGNKHMYSQMIGNIGGFANPRMDKDTQVIILENESIEYIKKGKKNDTILTIENFFNNCSSSIFDYKIVSETEFLDWIKARCERHDDTVTMDLYNAYIKSTNKGQNLFFFFDLDE